MYVQPGECVCTCVRALGHSLGLWSVGSCIQAEKEPGLFCTLSGVGGGEHRRMKWGWGQRGVKDPDWAEDRGRPSEETHQGLVT